MSEAEPASPDDGVLSSAAPGTADFPIRPRRLEWIDIARGLALVAMAAYHFTWDLAYFGVVPAATPFTTPMRAASHLIGSAFLALAGVSLSLAHARGWSARAFLRRLARIGAAAALVTGASFVVAPEAPIGFGILHCIFVGSLLTAPFLIAPLSRVQRGLASLSLGLILAALPAFVSSPSFDPPWLVWLGLGDQAPSTLDWRPIMPWGGVLLIGFALATLLPLPPSDGRAKAALARALGFAGRHSLSIYLIHQPLLLGLLYVVLNSSGFAERQSVDTYLKACRPACVEAGGEIGACDRACACVVRDASGAGLAGRLGAHSLSNDERGRIGKIVEDCGSQSR
jgi:uncharacterized membrane protein